MRRSEKKMKHLVILASILAVGFLGACASMDEGMKKEEMKKAEAKPAAPKKKKLPPSGSPFTVYFKNNSVDLTEKSHGDLFDILQKVGVYKPKEVNVSVYSDMTGSADYNKKLAEKRGKMLQQEIKDAGAKTINVNAVGAADPIVDKKGKVDANRRAVISFK
jgi:outer membrane protein OmpA-like peptidoglycan-associated protein